MVAIVIRPEPSGGAVTRLAAVAHLPVSKASRSRT
jgi:hypothetical protein